MDASGTHDDSHNCVVAGYWGSENEWRRFERAWSFILLSEGIEEFHANEFWPRIPGKGRIGPYAGWSDERHAGFIDRLLSVIEATKIIPFACGVVVAEWEKLPSERKELYSRNHKKTLQTPLFLSLQRAVTRTAGYCHTGITMHFTFDEDRAKSELMGAIASTYLDVKNWIAEDVPSLLSKLGDFGFADSKAASPLQAADLIAYEAHRYAKAAKDNERHPVRNEYRRALKRFKSQDDFWMFNAKRFQSLDEFLERSAANAVMREDDGSEAQLGA